MKRKVHRNDISEVIKETRPDIEIRPAGSKVPYNATWDAKLQSIQWS